MRRAAVIVIVGVAAAAACSAFGTACSAFGTSKDDVTPADAGAPVAVAVDAPSGPTDDASVGVDATRAPASCLSFTSGRGAPMVRIDDADGGPFCVDSVEVTNANYAAFLAALENPD